MVNAQLRYYLHLHPESLSDTEWAMCWNELSWIREQEKQQQQQ